jgi:hypothetical protein
MKIDMGEGKMDEVSIEERFSKVWCDRMDHLFKSHIGKDVKPYTLTNKTDILALGLGMGFAEMKIKDGNFVIETKYPVDVRWNGEKFEVAIPDADDCK